MVQAATTPATQADWNTISVSGSRYFNARNTSTGNQYDEIARDVPIAAGTWAFDLFPRRLSSNGMYTVSFDGATWARSTEFGRGRGRAGAGPLQRTEPAQHDHHARIDQYTYRDVQPVGGH